MLSSGRPTGGTIWIKLHMVSLSFGLATFCLMLGGIGILNMGWDVANWVPVVFAAVGFTPLFILRHVARDGLPILRIGQSARKFYSAENVLNVFVAVMVAVSLSGYWIVVYAVILGRMGLGLGLFVLICGIVGILGALVVQDFVFIWEMIANVTAEDGAELESCHWKIHPRHAPSLTRMLYEWNHDNTSIDRRFAALARRSSHSVVFLSGLLPALVFMMACSLVKHRGTGQSIVLAPNLGFLPVISSFIIVATVGSAVGWIMCNLPSDCDKIFQKRLTYDIPFAVFAAIMSAWSLTPLRWCSYVGFASMAATFLIAESWLFRIFFIYSRINVPTSGSGYL